MIVLVRKSAARGANFFDRRAVHLIDEEFQRESEYALSLATLLLIQLVGMSR
jgi:hypothetical protein